MSGLKAKCLKCLGMLSGLVSDVRSGGGDQAITRAADATNRVPPEAVAIWKMMISYWQLAWLVSFTKIAKSAPMTGGFDNAQDFLSFTATSITRAMSLDCLLPQISWSAGDRAAGRLLIQAFGFPILLVVLVCVGMCLLLCWSKNAAPATTTTSKTAAAAGQEPQKELPAAESEKRSDASHSWPLHDVSHSSEDVESCVDSATVGSSKPTNLNPLAAALGSFWPVLVVSILVVVHLSYPTIVDNMFSLVECSSLQKNSLSDDEYKALAQWFNWTSTDMPRLLTWFGMKSARSQYWQQDYSFTCFHGQHLWVASLACTTLFVCLVVPLVGWWWFRWACRQKLGRQSNRLDAFDQKQQYAFLFLYSEFRPNYAYWEFVIMLRKFSLLSVLFL
eukprot:gene8327-8512_t